jgi:uncharacterized protein with HEPN domain
MNDVERLEKIRRHCRLIIEYTKEIGTLEEFQGDQKTIDAVTLNLQQIGEAAKGLSEKAKRTFSSVEWNEIAGLRNRITHDYDGLNLEFIFRSSKEDVPLLLLRLSN